MGKPLQRRVIAVACILLSIYLLAASAAAVYLAQITIELGRKPVSGRADFASALGEQFHVPLEDVAVSADDGVALKGWYAQPQAGNGATVILLHGMGDNREGVAGFGPMFLRHGYSVLLPDSRGHGESGGLPGYGVRERYDVRRWVAFAERRSPGCVYLFGESMGAAIALQATAVTPELCAVAVESPFSNFREIGYDRIAEFSGTPEWAARFFARPVVELALAYGRRRYHVNLEEADPAAALAHSSVPALLIAGSADRNIPMRHSRLIMQAAGSHATLWIVPGADHGAAVSVAPQEFEKKVIGFFAEHAAATVRSARRWVQ